MKNKEIIEKFNRETGYNNLRKASTLKGNETEKELQEIYSKCLDIQGINLLNSMREQGKNEKQEFKFNPKQAEKWWKALKDWQKQTIFMDR